MSLVELIELPDLGDERGGLSVIEGGNSIPFMPKRIYYIYGTDPLVSRGFHAHKELEQMAVCVSGACEMLLDNGKYKETIHMNSPKQGVMIPPMFWHEMHNFSSDCVLLVLASEHYNESDYIRNYKCFIDRIGVNL